MPDNPVIRKVTVLNPAGLHARPSLAIVKAVRGSQSKVQLCTPRQSVDAADILQLLGLGAVQGTELTLSATGPDAEQVVDQVAKMFLDRFDLCGDPG
jgi:phosphocarrier protein HPr